MTVAQLKEQLIGVPDEAVLLVPARDHAFRRAVVELQTVICYPRLRGFGYEEPGGDEHGVKVKALVIL